MKLLNNLKYLITEAASLDDIQKSIGSRNVVTIYYDGDEDSGATGKGYRIIEPVCLGIHKNTGNMVLCAWEREGRSYSRDKKNNPIPGWRLFRIDKIFTYKPTMDTFYEVRPNFNPTGDKRMSRIIKIVNFNE
jgi:predicted DNA-binding transcriptional regulator YafY